MKAYINEELEKFMSTKEGQDAFGDALAKTGDIKHGERIMLSDRDIEKLIATRTLDHIPFTFGLTAPENWLKTVNVEVMVNEVSKEFAAQINFNLPGVKIESFIDSPRTWADAFKLTHFPKWLLEYFPAQTDRIVVQTINHLYPQGQFGRSVVVGRSR